VKVAISQPTYLPWLGYFDLIDQVDIFVFLDSVQFEKQSWQQRNRIKTPAGLQWLTVPVVFRGRLSQQIKDVEIRELDFWRKHLRAIELNYRRCPFFDTYFPELTSLLTKSFGAASLLVDLNVRLIEWTMRILGVRTRCVRSSSLERDGKRTELLVNLCTLLRARTYLSPLGSAGYLIADMQRFVERGIDVAFQHYEHPVYRQQFPPFCAYGSLIDLLFNEGDRSLEILRSGRKRPFGSNEVSRPDVEGVKAE
jgi:WbqC-like protein family